MTDDTDRLRLGKTFATLAGAVDVTAAEQAVVDAFNEDITIAESFDLNADMLEAIDIFCKGLMMLGQMDTVLTEDKYKNSKCGFGYNMDYRPDGLIYINLCYYPALDTPEIYNKIELCMSGGDGLYSIETIVAEPSGETDKEYDFSPEQYEPDRFMPTLARWVADVDERYIDRAKTLLPHLKQTPPTP